MNTKDYFGDVWRELDDDDAPVPCLSNAVRREVWYSRVPGTSTEAKVLNLLDFYETANAIADAMLASPQADADRQAIRDVLDRDMPGELEDLPEDMIAMQAPCVCTDCGEELITDIFALEDGWYTSEAMCPDCGSDKIVVVLPRVRAYL